MTTPIRTFSELIRHPTFEERYEYLRIGGSVGHSTFGWDRWLNQAFYGSYEWKQIRNFVITRDDGLDLAMPGYEIHDGVFIHHMNPLGVDDIIHREETALDPEYLITVSRQTHNAIHYGDKRQLPQVYVPRSPGDTKLW